MGAAAKVKPKIKTETAIVTRSEILELAKAEQEYTRTQAQASAAEENVKARRIMLAEKVLGLIAEPGLSTEQQLKSLAPDEVQRLYALRLSKKLWTTERDCPFFEFEKSSHGRYPPWKSLFTGVAGEGRTLQVQAETSVTYSYRVKVSP